jgi:hypothetical protein
LSFKNAKLWFIVFVFVLAFIFRLLFGLLAPPNRSGNDQQQTYLIGLKAYTTNTWPYFGPDTIEPTSTVTYQSQIPGALEGVLIAGALKIWSDPMAPYVLLNILTFSSFLFFGWYCSRRITGIPPWFIYTSLFFAPWDLHVTTQIHNLSFGAVGSLLFFIGFVESTPVLTGRILPFNLANALMGFAFFWILQFHLSWVLFAVLIVGSFILQIKNHKVYGVVFFFLGALPTFSFILPTYLKYGFQVASDSSGLLVHFNFYNFKDFFTVLARYLSFACSEMPRWIGDHTPDRKAFLMSAWWLLIPCLFLLVAGWIQVLLLIFLWFKRDEANPQWRWMKLLTAGIFLMIWTSFCFTARQPDAHRYYLIFPFVFYYSFLCWRFLVASLFWKRMACVFIFATIFFQVGYVSYYANLNNLPHWTSNYLADKDKIKEAIKNKNYQLLAERWPFSLY